MDQHRLSTILNDLSFGQEAAENDDKLFDLFVSELDVYRRIAKDEIDILTGGKGTGKSAIYRKITETELAAGLAVIPASNPTASPVFQVLFLDKASESRLRGIWTAYVTGLVGNWIVDEYSGVPGVKYAVGEIEELLQLLGLRKAAQEKASLLDRIRSAKSVEASAEASIAGSVSGGLKFDLPDGGTQEKAVVLQAGDFHSVIAKCAEVLEAKNARLWVAFDRLDECVIRDSDAERRALRALLRTHLDIAQTLAYSRTIRMKIFLRRDLLRRMTNDAAFTNSTHLRQADLRWNSKAIAHLIAKRALISSEFVAEYAEELVADRVLGTWSCLLTDERGKAVSDDFIYRLCVRMSDGNREFNPRNVIALFNSATARARANQDRALDTGRANRNRVPLLSNGELQASESDVSRKRFQDSVLNEFPMAAKYAPRLEGGPAEFRSLDELMATIGTKGVTSDVAENIANELCLSGVLSVKGQGYAIPRLYRAALHPQVRT